MFGIDTQSSSHVELQSQDNNSVPPGWQVARPLMMFSSSLLSWCTVVLILLAWGWLSKAEDAAVHLTLHRRGGRFATHDAANLTRLAAVLGEVELRYARTERIVEGNRLGRQWKSRNTGTTNDDDLIASVGHDGRWFHNLHMSDPKQTVELEIDMLSPDFYVSTTTSGRGSQYNAFVTSHISNGDRVHPLCQHPTDLFHLSTTPGSPPTLTNLTFSMCSPSHSHTLTLSRSGATLGLSPPNTQLSRLTSPPLLTQFHNLNLTPRRIWSLTLLTPSTGLLTLGASIATHIERARLSTSLSLENFGNPLFTPSHISSLIDAQMKDSFPHALEDQFHWVKMSGPHGLWTTLMSGVWIGGSKVLKNQPVLLDVNCPFILAPRLAVRRYYESIGGAQRISLPRSEENEWSARTRERKRETRFWKIPCLNEASVAWEFGGKMFGAFKEGRREDGLYGPAGGAMSLGKYVHEDGAGNGYCVGVVVESRMGVGGDEDSPWRNSGMRDVWVLGEPFFRGLGVVFDAETEGGRIGLRNY